MQLMRTFSRMTTLLALASVLLFSIDALAAAATVTNLNGTVSARKADGSMRLLSQQSEVDAGESITTEKNSFARLKFSDGGEITLRPETTIAIDSYRFEADKPEQDNLFFTMVKGGLRTITGLVGKRGNRDAYRNKTAIATIGIRGTDYGSLLCDSNCGKLPDGQYIDVKQGKINVVNTAGNLDVEVGQFAYVKDANTAPVLLPGDPGLPEFDEDDTVGNGLGTFDTGLIPGGAGCVVN
jgi:hypothetical protein